MSSYELETRDLLRQHGTFMRRSNHGELWMVGEATVMVLAPGCSNNNDPRAWKNNLAEIKRALRPKEKEEMNAQSPPARPSRPNLRELGVHVKTNKRVIEESLTEACLPVEAIAMALGLTGGEIAAEYELKDVNGKLVAGPMTLVVKTITERTA
jgi:hypothetical protein